LGGGRRRRRSKDHGNIKSEFFVALKLMFKLREETKGRYRFSSNQPSNMHFGN